MKLSVSNIGWESAEDTATYRLMGIYGFSGLEIAPTRIFPQNPYRKLTEAEKWASDLSRQYGFVISSMQSIWFGRQEKLFGDAEERQALIDYTKKAINFAEVIGCRNLVFGCPRNRQLLTGANAQSAVPFFKTIGDYASLHHTVVGMEANPPIYNTNYINDTLSALKLIEEVDSPGFLLNLDTGTMIENQELIHELAGKVSFINHVHISEPELKPIKQRVFHRELKDILKSENYQGFVSVEMGKTGYPQDLENALQYVAEVFS